MFLFRKINQESRKKVSSDQFSCCYCNHSIKWLRADGSYIVGGAATAVFESTREGVAHKYGGDATHYSEIDTAIDRDARAVAEKNLKLAAENGDGFYRGLGAYKSYSGKDNATTNASG